MITETDPPLLSVSVRVYQSLLFAYPARFREEYEAHMVQVFRDCTARALQQGGMDRILRVWAITFIDFFRSVLVEHLQKEARMSRSQFIKISSWAIIVSAFGFLTFFTQSDPYSLTGSTISSILLAVGMVGLWMRTKDSGHTGRGFLLAGVIGMVILYLLLACGAVLRSFGMPTTQLEQAFSDGLWVLLFGGPTLVLLGLTFFGLSSLQYKPQARAGWLAVLAGIWYPALYFSITGYLITHHGYFPFFQYQTISIVLIVTQFLALIVFGLLLAVEPVPEMATN